MLRRRVLPGDGWDAAFFLRPKDRRFGFIVPVSLEVLVQFQLQMDSSCVPVFAGGRDNDCVDANQVFVVRELVFGIGMLPG